MINSHLFRRFLKRKQHPLKPGPAFLVTLIPLLVLCSGCSTVFFHSTRQDVGIAGEDGFKIKKQIVIEENTIYQNNRSGVLIRGDAPVHISNCDIYQNGRAGINLEQSAEVAVENSNVFKNKNSGIAANNTSRVLIRNTMVHQNLSSGIRVRQNEQARQPSTYVLLQQDKIFLNGRGGIQAIADTPGPIRLIVSENAIHRNRKTGIRVEDNIRLTADNNEIYKNGTGGIASYLSGDQAPMLDIYQNKIYSNVGAGIFVRSGITGEAGISNNLIYNNYRGGLALGLLNQSAREVIDVEVFHNTIVANGSDEEGAGIRNDSSGEVLIKNNIIAYNFTTGIMSQGCGGFSYNLLFANGETSDVKPDSEDFAYLTEKVQYSGCSGRQWGDILAQPLFVNPDRYDFSLRRNSPARNAADTVNSVYFEAFPNPDMGAIPFPFPGKRIQE